MSKNKHVDLDNAREVEQREVMEQIIADDNCPFCEENLRKYHKQPILRESKHWFLTKNQWPYEHTKVHLLLILRQHAENLDELPPESGVEMIEHLQWAAKEFDVPGGGFVMRFGDTDYSAGSVQHLHMQFLQPDINDPNYMDKPLRVKIGKTR